ncbi:CehA/McbA family metallohydrolase [Novosphingobium rosa]|uniref:CehA/McbA family metallohydrolase n=1 Tax=Novosphingobium rosa TaxID=76978 RepID=UPI0008357FBB|nr:CehA/McbA family metallohydrolase [Novosphingobium rosa]
MPRTLLLAPALLAPALLAPALLAPALLTMAQPALAAPLPDVVLTGTLHDSDRATYRELPFDVPAGVTKMTIDVDGADPSKGTYLVLGVYDPQRERGWGGAIKPHITLAETFASTSYLPGPLPAGRWRLSVAVAFIKPGNVTPYKVTVHFDQGPAAQVLDPGVKKAGPGWYRGDFHVHTGQSDAQCRSVPGGKAVPCPVWHSLKAAYDKGLDFVSVSDHNVTSHYAELAQDAPYFDSMLVIPGREMTTQYGHFNLTGITDFIDFRVGGAGYPSVNAIFDAAKPTGALISLNHPEIPTGETCLGCGWSAPDTDFKRVDAIEVANGGIAADAGGHFDDGSGSGTAWWEAQLNKGHHLTGIGGSDNHDPLDGRAGTSPVGGQSPVGMPATVVFAQNLSQRDLLAGVRSGRVFIDLGGANPAHLLDMAAGVKGGPMAPMGSTLERGACLAVAGQVHVRGEKGAHVDLIVDGRHQGLPGGGAIASDEATIDFTLPAAIQARWFRADVRGADGKRLLIGNPIYLETRKACAKP